MKLKFKTCRKVWSLALVAMMVMTLCLFSTDLTVQAGDTGVPGTDATAVVTKTLQIANSGVTPPNTSFSFTFTPYSFNGLTSATGSMPSIASVSIPFTSSDSISSGEITHESSDVLASVSSWPSAGLYTYTVNETVGTASVGGGTVTYSQAEYILEVVVANDSSGLYVKETWVLKKVNDDGTTATSAKGDPEPGQYGLKFTNSYTKPGGGTGDALVIGKTVTGTYADYNKSFSFTLAVTFPATATAGTTYTGTVHDDTGTATTTTYSVSSSSPSVTFTLKHDETLVFTDLPAGTTYTLSEAGNANYTASYSVVQDSTTAVTDTAANIGDGLSTTSKATSMLVGENTNTANFTNAFSDSSVTPTGILLNNLPYIILIAAVVLGLVAFAALKRRREMQ